MTTLSAKPRTASRRKEWSPGRGRAILLDLTMPLMTGIQFLGELRQRLGGRDIPIITLSTQDLSPEERDRLHFAA